MEAFPICGYCGFATASRRKCTCRFIRYCDELCQLRDWSRHKEECTWRAGVIFLKRLSSREPFFDQHVVKLLAANLG